MPKAFLIKKKHEAMIAAQVTGVKRPWLDDMELPEDLSRSSCSPALSVSPAPSDCSVTVPDMTMPFDLSMKRVRVESPEPVATPIVTPIPTWSRVMMSSMPPFYYPFLPQLPLASPLVSAQSPLMQPVPLLTVPAARQQPQHDIAVVPSWSQMDSSSDNESSKTSSNSPPASPSSHSSTSPCPSAEVKGSFSCKFCPKSYVSLGALKMHVRTHTLPCKCDLCGKAFSRPWLLQGHIRTHTGEKPFECDHCHRAFADRSNLRAHLQTHQEVKKYSCSKCAKTFSRASLLHKHQDSGSCCQNNVHKVPRPSPQSSPAAAVPGL